MLIFHVNIISLCDIWRTKNPPVSPVFVIKPEGNRYGEESKEKEIFFADMD